MLLLEARDERVEHVRFLEAVEREQVVAQRGTNGRRRHALRMVCCEKGGGRKKGLLIGVAFGLRLLPYHNKASQNHLVSSASPSALGRSDAQAGGDDQVERGLGR